MGDKSKDVKKRTKTNADDTAVDSQNGREMTAKEEKAVDETKQSELEKAARPATQEENANGSSPKEVWQFKNGSYVKMTHGEEAGSEDKTAKDAPHAETRTNIGDGEISDQQAAECAEKLTVEKEQKERPSKKAKAAGSTQARKRPRNMLFENAA